MPAHALEHSLEVQLPFLQEVLGDFALVPFAVGDGERGRRSRRCSSACGAAPETLIVISTDMSHYHAYEQARAIDGATLERIAALRHRHRSRGGLRRDAAERAAAFFASRRSSR